MKQFMALILLTALTSAFAEGYKAPSFKMPTSKPVDAKAKKTAWDDESHFKVEEGVEAERDLASSPERDADWAKPEAPAPEVPAKDEGRIIPWKMIDKH